ncbi:MAG: dockerin type I domain-containing protein [Rubripirellula sp.]
MIRSRKLPLRRFERLEKRELLAVDFQFTYAGPIGSGIGFEDATNGQARRDALESAADQFGQWFDHTATIQLSVESEENINSDTIASAFSEGAEVGLDEAGFGIAEVVRRKVIDGVDLNGNATDGGVSVNWAIDWYLGADPAGASADQEDFFGTIFHEIAHTFGFASDVDVSGEDAFGTPVGEPGVWARFDRFLTNSQGQLIIDGTSFALNGPRWDAAKVGGASPSNGLFFSGPNAIAANAGQPIGLFSPTVFSEGSSGSHLDDENPQFDLALMRSAGLGGVPAPRTLATIEKAIFVDLGYTLTTPAIVVAETENATIVSETGTTDTIEVSLSTAPNADVILEIAGDATEVSAAPIRLTFTPFDWHVKQAVTLTGVDDSDDDGDILSTLTISVIEADSSDEFDGAADQTVVVTTLDDDAFAPASLIVGESGDVTRVTERGTVDVVTVALSRQPSSGVTVLVQADDPTEATLDVTQVAFTVDNWNLPQLIVVTGVDDQLLDGSQASNLIFSVDAESSDNAFDNVTASISIETSDHETISVGLSTDSIVESQIATGTLTRSNMDVDSVFLLTSDDPTRISAPVSVMIPAGQSSAEFEIRGLEDLVAEAVSVVSLTVESAGYESGSGAITVADNAFPFNNPNEQNDVNNDGMVTARDALLIINQLARGTALTTPPGNFYDVTGEGNVTSLDALRVINELARISVSNSSTTEPEHLTAVDAFFQELTKQDM